MQNIFLILCDDTQEFRSSRTEVFCKKVVLRNFAEFTGNQLCQSLSFNKVAGLTLYYGDYGTGGLL